ncbi:MAG: hypothetical protein R3F14_06480 [Polyangiaceae bacterium]
MSESNESPHRYVVRRSDRKPLVDFMLNALIASGCRILHAPEPNRAPFRITFETAEGERMGIIAYAFLANSRVTKNRPLDEHRFQIGRTDRTPRSFTTSGDPYGVYVTGFGIDSERGIFVGADPEIHRRTKFFISSNTRHRTPT